MYVCGTLKNGTDELVCRAEVETQMLRTNIWTPRGGETAVGWGWWCAELGDWD